jgi:F-type H+-transporting ATPase subunit b
MTMKKTFSLIALASVLAPVAFAASEATGKARDEAVGFGYLAYGLTDTTTVVAFFALVVFLAFVWWVGGFKMICGALDKRAEDIKSQLEEAKTLREEAMKALAEAKTKAAEADAAAEEIVKRAKADADAMMKQAKVDLEAKVTRREAQAEARIARAEADAASDVRKVAADAATEAARTILSGSSEGDDLFEKALKEIDGRLN